MTEYKKKIEHKGRQETKKDRGEKRQRGKEGGPGTSFTKRKESHHTPRDRAHSRHK